MRKIFKLILFTLIIFIIYEALTWPSVGKLVRENPTTTALIEVRLTEARTNGKVLRRDQIWLPYNQISSNLKRAVLAGEDAKFFGHDGFDREELEKAMKESWEKKSIVRGASTISQQLVKNLYLSESKNPLRKIKEAILTWQMEKIFPKERILEIYLNIIEWGDGIYGAEAAAQYHLHKSASNLSADESAYLAAMIPNPRTVYNPEKNLKRVNRRKQHILRLMVAIRIPN